MSKTISIIVHVYAEAIPDYAALFTAQLSSLVLWPPKTCAVDVTCWTAETDSLTHRVCAAFRRHFQDHATPAVVQVRTLPKKELFRRAIGRNISALECEADVCWFSDADYLYAEGMLDALAAVDFAKVSPHEMIFPKRYWMMTSHEAGDAEIARISAGSIFRPNLEPYYRKRLKMGIGGLQIVSREIANRGYCKLGSRYLRPRATEQPFPDTDEDRIYRGTIKSSIPVDFGDQLYRLRHSRTSYENGEDRRLRMCKKQNRRGVL